MRITTSSNYHKDAACGFDNCRRLYCPYHRYLYNWCDGVQQDTENDMGFYSDSDCWHCNIESRRTRYANA